jgi:uncharacterized protein DUF4365
MKRQSNVDRQGVALTNFIFEHRLHWTFRELTGPDFGIDALVEIISDGNTTGDLIALQVKSGESYLDERTDKGFVFREEDKRHLEYWQLYSIPVLLILCSPERQQCWWQPIDLDLIEFTYKGWKTIVPLENELGEKSAEAILAFVKKRRARRSADDELSAICLWLGRCKLVHKLDQSLSPMNGFQVPDLLAIFEVNGRAVPVLIEVAEYSEGGVPAWEPDHIDSLQRYAALLGLPLLIGLKYGSIWSLFESRHLRREGNKLTIVPTDAIMESLLCLLAGDFSFSFRPGVGMHIVIRRLSEPDIDGRFNGVVEEAYLLNPEGEKHSGAEGLLTLFACIEQESHIEETETHAVQSFVIPDSGQAEFAHRVLLTMFGGMHSPIDWSKVMFRIPLLSISPRQAVHEGLKSGFIRHHIIMSPRTPPLFI